LYLLQYNAVHDAIHNSQAGSAITHYSDELYPLQHIAVHDAIHHSDASRCSSSESPTVNHHFC
jgi:hypothetical protein